MPTYRRSGGSVTRSHLRVRAGGSTMGAGRRIRNPIADPPPVPTGTMTYTAEPIGAGGWVTGISISPDGSNRLVRTDTLGAWRWDTGTDQWQPAITATTMPADGSAALDSGQGVQALAAGNTACYMGYKSSIYKSVDGGLHWTTSLASGPGTAPNTGNQRWWNSHMALDPADNNVCIYGTYAAGLYTTTNGGTTWTQVDPAVVPVGAVGFGIPCVAIDGSGNWYAAPLGSGVYRSTNRGATWTNIGGPVAVTGMASGPNGDLMVTGHTSATTLDTTTIVAYRYRAGTWTAMSVGNGLWRPVAYDPLNPGRVHLQADAGYQRVSLDYGDTWGRPFQSMTSDGDIPWLAAANGFGADFFFVTVGGLQFDPVVAGRLWMSQGIGVWYSDVPAGNGTRIPWQAQSRGIEQLVVNDVLTPPGGAPVVTSWDRAVFLAGESGAIPLVVVTPTAQTPIGTPGGLTGTLVGGYPTTITYAWSVVSKPVASTGGSFSAPSSLSTAFTPDVAGDYVLRISATNVHGTGTTDVTLTAVPPIRGLVFTGSNTTYFSTPDATDLDLTGSLTLRARLSLPDWTPAAAVPIIGKNVYPQVSYTLVANTDGTLKASFTTSGTGATGALNLASAAHGFPDGSIQWVQVVYDATLQRATFYKSPDGITWTEISHKPTTGVGTSPLYVGTSPLAIGGNGIAGSTATIYRAVVLNASGTVVADLDTSGVTRTGVRTPATVTGSTGKVWSGTGTGWDWTT